MRVINPVMYVLNGETGIVEAENTIKSYNTVTKNSNEQLNRKSYHKSESLFVIT